MRQSIIVVDDFYDDPLEVRERALDLDFPDDDGAAYYSGRNSRLALINRPIVDAISRLVLHPLTPSPNSANGHFRIGLAGDLPRQDIHIDPGRDWAGVLFLNPPEQCRGGTSFWRHKETGLEAVPLRDDDYPCHGFTSYEHLRWTMVNGDGLDRSKWELTMQVPMRFNRLVLFRPWLWHSHTENFGDGMENGRLIQVFFFDYRTAQRPTVAPFDFPRTA